MKRWLEAMGYGEQSLRALSYDDAAAAALSIARGEATDAQIAAFLVLHSTKQDADEEVAAFADVFHNESLPYPIVPQSLICTEPVNGREEVPVTLPVSLLLAAAGFPQVVNVGCSSAAKTGVSFMELLEGLGVRMDVGVPLWETCFRESKIGFIDPEAACPALARVRRIRNELGVPTLFDTIEKLFNPLRSSQMSAGASGPAEVEKLLRYLPKTGIQRACIVAGTEGSEEVPVWRTSLVYLLTPWGDETSILDPSTFGFTGKPLEKTDKKTQLQCLERLIQGDGGEDLQSERDHVIWNAGLRLYWFEKASSYEEGFQLARQLYERKGAYKVLNTWRKQVGKERVHPKRKAN